MIEKLNSISNNVWAVAILLIGCLLVAVCFHYAKPIEPASLLIGGGLTLLQRNSEHPPQGGK